MRALLVPLFLGWARAAPNASAWCRAACGFDWRSTVPLESDDVLSGCAYRDLAHYVIDHDGVVDYRAVDTTAVDTSRKPIAATPPTQPGSYDPHVEHLEKMAGLVDAACRRDGAVRVAAP